MAFHLLVSLSSTFFARIAAFSVLREDSFGPRSSSSRCLFEFDVSVVEEVPLGFIRGGG